MDNQLSWMQRHRRFLFISGPSLLLGIIALFYLFTRHFVSTDDAYTRAANVSINASVSGKVVAVFVHDNQTVKQGELLFRLDQRPFKIAVARAKAELTNAYLHTESLKATYEENVAEIQAAEDTLFYESEELARQKKMTASGLSSQAQLNKVQNDFNTATQTVLIKKQQQNTLAQLNNDANISADQLPDVKIALANLHQAELNLSYTEIKAPINGIVTKVENLQKGDYVQTGVPVFALISNQDVWIEANYKETQLTNIHPGQTAEIKIDAYPNKKWLGHVVSQSPGTGSVFSLLPPENATGNWVKIVQRLPVRVSIEQTGNTVLASGLSAVVTIDTDSDQ